MIIYNFEVVILYFLSLFLLHYILEEILYFLLHNNNLTCLVSLQIKILTYKHIKSVYNMRSEGNLENGFYKYS